MGECKGMVHQFVFVIYQTIPRFSGSEDTYSLLFTIVLWARQLFCSAWAQECWMISEGLTQLSGMDRTDETSPQMTTSPPDAQSVNSFTFLVEKRLLTAEEREIPDAHVFSGLFWSQLPLSHLFPSPKQATWSNPRFQWWRNRLHLLMGELQYHIATRHDQRDGRDVQLFVCLFGFNHSGSEKALWKGLALKDGWGGGMCRFPLCGEKNPKR